MSQFRGHAKSLGELYVFYKRVGEVYPTLGKYVRSDALRILNQTKKYSRESESVYAMAKAEFNKEKKLLTEKFGVTLSLDYYDRALSGRGFKEVVEALNTVINLKEVYERNKILIKHTRGNKAVFSYFPTYFMQAWDERAEDVQEEWANELKRTTDMAEALRIVLDKMLPEILDLGIKKMLNGPEVELNIIPSELKDAYTSLISEIGNMSQAGSIANQLYKAYQLEELKESLAKEITEAIDVRTLRGAADKKIKTNLHQRGGYTLEAIETAIFQQMTRTRGGKAHHTGQLGMKADNILTLGIDSTLLEEAFERAGNNREKNIKALSELGDKISKLNDGFIVYSSDKNYTLNRGFSGFSAGQEERIQPFLTRIYKNSTSLNTLIGAINQLGKGAMLEEKEDAFEQMLAQDVAYMLFDDYTTIGEADAGGRSIHVMNLNGIMIPLSMILHLLAEAIDATDDENFIRRIVDVKIKVPEIEFKEDADQRAWEVANPEENAWDYQRQQTLRKSTIQAKFLSSFRTIVREFL